MVEEQPREPSSSNPISNFRVLISYTNISLHLAIDRGRNGADPVLREVLRRHLRIRARGSSPGSGEDAPEESPALRDTMVLSNYIEEIVVSAVSYHLMNNKEPEYRNGKLVISSKSVVIMKDGLGRSKGFGFVSFQEPELAQKAMDAMNDSMLGTQFYGKRLYVAQAEHKEDRRKPIHNTTASLSTISISHIKAFIVSQKV